jgi:hypothetical protein
LVWSRSRASSMASGTSTWYMGAPVQLVTEFDRRFDELWERLRSHQELLWCVRDRETLAWHYRYALARGDAWIFTATENAALCAFAIVLRQDNAKVGLKRARLVDLQALPGNEDALTPIVAAILRQCRHEGVHMLESIGFTRSTRAFLESHSPYSRRLPAWLFFYKAKDEALDRALSSGAMWNVCSYDGDGSL